jgi:hypothetical protein
LTTNEGELTKLIAFDIPKSGQFGKANISKNPSIREIDRSLSPTYEAYEKSMIPTGVLEKRFNTNTCPTEKFTILATDPVAGLPNDKSISEAILIIQAEHENLFKFASRELNQDLAIRVNLDFLIVGPFPFKYADVKTPVSSEFLHKLQPCMTLERMAYDIGVKLARQKNDFLIDNLVVKLLVQKAPKMLLT